MVKAANVSEPPSDQKEVNGMKARTTLLILASLLLVSSLAFAVPAAAAPAAPPAAAPAAFDLAAALVPPAMSPLAGPSCSTSLAAVSLPGTTPAPVALAIHCGTCSQSSCVNATIGTYCVQGRKLGTCQNAYGNDCGGQPITWQCECWNGPLP
jgi:hypothetical protein